MATTPEDQKLKELIKSALIDALEERRDLVKEIVSEAMEDIGFANAIGEGLATKPVSRNDVFEILEPTPGK